MKSQSQDSETSQALSFGAILKGKEKQLQHEQEISASSAAIALVAMQTASMTLPILQVKIENVDTQLAVETESSDRTAVESHVASASSRTDMAQKPFVSEIQTNEIQFNQTGIISLPASILTKHSEQPEFPITLQTAPVEEFPSRSHSLTHIRTEKSSRLNTAEAEKSDKPFVQNVPIRFSQITTKTITGAEEVSAPSEEPRNGTSKPGQTAMLSATSELPVSSTPARTAQEKLTAETKTEDLNTPVSTADVFRSESALVREAQIPEAKVFTNTSAPSKSFIETVLKTQSESLIPQPMVEEEKTNTSSPTDNEPQTLPSKGTASPKKAVVKAEPVGSRGHDLISHNVAGLKREGVFVEREPSTRITETHAPNTKVSVQPQILFDAEYIQVGVQQAEILTEEATSNSAQRLKESFAIQPGSTSEDIFVQSNQVEKQIGLPRQFAENTRTANQADVSSPGLISNSRSETNHETSAESTSPHVDINLNSSGILQKIDFKEASENIERPINHAEIDIEATSLSQQNVVSESKTFSNQPVATISDSEDVEIVPHPVESTTKPVIHHNDQAPATPTNLPDLATAYPEVVTFEVEKSVPEGEAPVINSLQLEISPSTAKKDSPKTYREHANLETTDQTVFDKKQIDIPLNQSMHDPAIVQKNIKQEAFKTEPELVSQPGTHTPDITSIAGSVGDTTPGPDQFSSNDVPLPLISSSENFVKQSTFSAQETEMPSPQLTDPPVTAPNSIEQEQINLKTEDGEAQKHASISDADHSETHKAVATKLEVSTSKTPRAEAGSDQEISQASAQREANPESSAATAAPISLKNLPVEPEMDESQVLAQVKTVENLIDELGAVIENAHWNSIPLDDVPFNSNERTTEAEGQVGETFVDTTGAVAANTKFVEHAEVSFTETDPKTSTVSSAQTMANDASKSLKPSEETVTAAVRKIMPQNEVGIPYTKEAQPGGKQSFVSENINPPYSESDIAEVKTQPANHQTDQVTVPVDRLAINPALVQEDAELEAIFPQKDGASQTRILTNEGTSQAYVVSEDEDTLYQSVAQINSAQAELPFTDSELPQVETVVNRTKNSFENKSVEAQSAFTEVVTDIEVESVRKQDFARVVSPVTIDSVRSEALHFQAEIKLEEPAVEAQNIEPQTLNPVAPDAITETDLPKVTSPANTSPVEIMESVAIENSDFEGNPQRVLSISNRQKPDSHQRVAASPAATSFEAPRSTPSADNTAIPVSLPADSFTKVDPGKKVSKAEQITFTDEKIPQVEKQQAPNEIFDSASVTTHSFKEVAEIGSMEKGSANQIDTRAVEVVEQVIRKLNGKLKSGPTSMQLQLNPEALGVINVEVIRDSQGVSVTFFAEQASTGKLLETQLSQLRQSLVDSGVQLSGLNIGQHNHSRQEGGFQNQNTHFAQHSQREAPQSRANTTESPRAENVTGQMSEVDYLI